MQVDEQKKKKTKTKAQLASAITDFLINMLNYSDIIKITATVNIVQSCVVYEMCNAHCALAACAVIDCDKIVLGNWTR